MALHTNKGLVILTGYAHPGIMNILRITRHLFPKETIYLIVGGFDLGGISKSRIRNIAQEIKRLGVQNVAPIRCTGSEATTVFRELFGSNCLEVGVGFSLEIKGTLDSKDRESDKSGERVL